MPRLTATAATLLLTASVVPSLGRAQAPVLDLASPATFQTASIEPSTSGLIDIQVTPRSFTARTSTLAELIEYAYSLQPWEVVGGPEWVRVDRFTVQATTAADVSASRMRQMLQALLTDRFQLQLGHDTENVNLFRLTAIDAKKLKSASRPNERGAINLKGVDGASYRWEGRNAGMDALARALAQQLRRPVVNDTKLTGVYDFRLEFAEDTPFGHLDDIDRHVPTISSALQKQLGLRLQTGQGAVPVQVVRRAERPR